MSTPSIHAAHELVQALIGLGVREAVLAPGSRSAPLAYALAYAAREVGTGRASSALRLHVRIDERDAGFLALGLAKAGDGSPVAVVTTSGTAVANLLPAALEAHEAGVPLLLLTADRPHEMRGTGANQTTNQVGLFGTTTRMAVDVPAPTGRDGELRDLRALAARAVAAAAGFRGAHPGPVHLNLSYRDPLAPTVEDLDLLRGTPTPGPTANSPLAGIPRTQVLADYPVVDGFVVDDPAVLRLGLEREPATVVVAGDGAGPVARHLAEAQRWPLLAEATSGAAGGPALVHAHRLVLAGSPLTAQIRQVIVVGRPTVSRPVQELLARSDVRVIVVAPGAQPWPDAARNAAVVLRGIPAAWLESQVTDTSEVRVDDWRARWQQASSTAATVVDAAVASGPMLTSLDVAAAVARAHRATDVLVVGSSSPIRDLELVNRWYQPGRVLTNRGLAGIDGMISTILGVALAVQRLDQALETDADPANAGSVSQSGSGDHSAGAEQPHVVRALLGDLTFLHDVGGLLRGPYEDPVQAQIVVVNDGGGAIFDTLEHGLLGRGRVGHQADEDMAIVERVFGTPHTTELAALCAGYGVGYEAVTDPVRLEEVLACPAAGVNVVEVRVSRSRRGDAGRRLADDVAVVLNQSDRV